MREIFLAAIIGVMAAPAMATPPDVMILSDRVFGIGGSHVYLLRTFDDNRGRHIPGMHDVYLVEKNGVTGAEHLSPVSRTFRGDLPSSDEEWKGWNIVHYPIAEAVNPFEVLAEKGAVHVLSPRGEPRYEVTLTEDGLSVSDRGTQTHALDGEAVLAQLDASIAGTAAFIPSYPSVEGIGSTSTIPFPEILAEQRYALSECTPDTAQKLSARRSEQSILIVRLHCQREWESATLIVVVPPSQ